MPKFTKSSRPLIVALGEVLWDVFPHGRFLGGAPTNFAVHCAQLGLQAVLVSGLGDDVLGQDALVALSEHGVETSFIQQGGHHATGTVSVALQNGQPSYDIVEDVAWDYIVWCDQLKALAKQANAICFGTLAQRSAQSRETIQRFVDETTQDCLCVLDINIRQDYHSQDILYQSLALANVLKLNDDEVALLRSYVGGMDDVDAFLGEIRTRFQLKWIVLTMGEKGCRVFGPQGIVHTGGASQKVINTVGAGDAFTAAFVGHLLCGCEIDICAQKANAVGGYVVTQESATPALPSSFRIIE